MIFESQNIKLKDGRAAVLRAPESSDAQALLDYLFTISGETEFLLRTPEECTETLEDEIRFIEGSRKNPNSVMICCFVGGELAGNCSLSFNRRKKTAHRASIGIAIKKKYWSLGIGTAMFCAMIGLARARGISQLELEFIEGNSRARALYEKMGFRVVGIHPNGVRLSDGRLANEYLMILEL